MFGLVQQASCVLNSNVSLLAECADGTIPAEKLPAVGSWSWTADTLDFMKRFSDIFLVIFVAFLHFAGGTITS